jgi:hypothetical protein
MENEYDHSNDDLVYSRWKKCLHTSENHTCNPETVMFDEDCQTCGAKATWAMVFADFRIVLYACDKCK